MSQWGCQGGGEMAGNQEGAGGLGDAVALVAARRLLRVTTRTEAAVALHDALRDLGGQAVEARLADGAALPEDGSPGVGHPLAGVPGEGGESARGVLVQPLPYLLGDRRAAAERGDHELGEGG